MKRVSGSLPVAIRQEQYLSVFDLLMTSLAPSEELRPMAEDVVQLQWLQAAASCRDAGCPVKLGRS